jgi:hypothetical protein
VELQRDLRFMVLARGRQATVRGPFCAKPVIVVFDVVVIVFALYSFCVVCPLLFV